MNLQLQAIQKLASNPAALVLYAVVAGGGAGWLGGGLEEDLKDHVHELAVPLEVRRHWTADERRSLERRLETIEEKIEKPVPVDLDDKVEARLRKLELEIGTAIRLLEIHRSQSGASRP